LALPVLAVIFLLTFNMHPKHIQKMVRRGVKRMKKIAKWVLASKAAAVTMIGSVHITAALG
jgi:hypothetical protein